MEKIVTKRFEQPNSCLLEGYLKDGGYEAARLIHFILTMGYIGFFLVHIGQVVIAGWNNFRSMVIGWELVKGGDAQ